MSTATTIPTYRPAAARALEATTEFAARMRRAVRAGLGRRDHRPGLWVLDAETLRDLGVTPSEVGAYEAEASGLVPRTYLRLAGADLN